MVDYIAEWPTYAQIAAGIALACTLLLAAMAAVWLVRRKREWEWNGDPELGGHGWKPKGWEPPPRQEVSPERRDLVCRDVLTELDIPAGTPYGSPPPEPPVVRLERRVAALEAKAEFPLYVIAPTPKIDLYPQAFGTPLGSGVGSIAAGAILANYKTPDPEPQWLPRDGERVVFTERAVMSDGTRLEGIRGTVQRNPGSTGIGIWPDEPKPLDYHWLSIKSLLPGGECGGWLRPLDSAPQVRAWRWNISDNRLLWDGCVVWFSDDGKTGWRRTDLCVKELGELVELPPNEAARLLAAKERGE